MQMKSLTKERTKFEQKAKRESVATLLINFESL